MNIMNKLFFLFALLFVVSCSSGNKRNQADETSAQPVEVVETTINIGGMHCDMCVASIEKGVKGVEGIASVTVSLNDSNAVVSYYASRTSLEEIEKAIEKRGYKVKSEM